MIEDAQWRYDLRAQASVLTISGTGTVDWDDEGDGVRSLILPGGGFNPPARRVRPAEQNQDVPYYNEPTFVCHVTTVRLPEISAGIPLVVQYKLRQPDFRPTLLSGFRTS